MTFEGARPPKSTQVTVQVTQRAQDIGGSRNSRGREHVAGILQFLWCHILGPIFFCLFIASWPFILSLAFEIIRGAARNEIGPQSPDDPYEFYGGEFT